MAEYDWEWLKSVVQANRLEVTSNGLWLAQEPEHQISLTPQGRVQLLSRERELPSDRGIVPFDVFQGVPQRRLRLLPLHSVGEEEQASLTEVAISSQLALLDKQQE